jgi:hypothetical protein
MHPWLDCAVKLNTVAVAIAKHRQIAVFPGPNEAFEQLLDTMWESDSDRTVAAILDYCAGKDMPLCAGPDASLIFRTAMLGQSLASALDEAGLPAPPPNEILPALLHLIQIGRRLGVVAPSSSMILL